MPEPLHLLEVDALFLRLAKGGRAEVGTALAWGLVRLHHDAMRLGIGVVADTGHLPRDLQTRRAACDLKAVVLDLLGDVEGANPPIGVNW